MGQVHQQHRTHSSSPHADLTSKGDKMSAGKRQDLQGGQSYLNQTPAVNWL